MFFHLYGLLIGIGIWFGSGVAQKAQRRLGAFRSVYLSFSLDEAILWIFIPAVVGARAYHVIDLWTWYSAHPGNIIAIWEGGIGIYGAILGGLFGAWLFAFKVQRRQGSTGHEVRSIKDSGIRNWELGIGNKAKPNVKLSTPNSLFFIPNSVLWTWLAVMDIIMIGTPVAQAIGRFGNYFNQELFGSPTALPWGIFIDPTKRPFGYETVTHFHPLFLYEAILNSLLGLWLWRQSFQKRPVGSFFAAYLIGYGLIRFALDFLRINPWQGGVLTVAQWVSVGIIGIGFILVLKARK